MLQIPVTNQPNQSFRVSLPLGEANISLDFFIYWNRIADYWQMNIGDGSNGEALINSLPLVGGEAPAQNILRQWEYLNIGKLYVVPLATAEREYPGVTGWGSNFILVWDE